MRELKDESVWPVQNACESMMVASDSGMKGLECEIYGAHLCLELKKGWAGSRERVWIGSNVAGKKSKLGLWLGKERQYACAWCVPSTS